MNKDSLQKLIKICLDKHLNFVVFSLPNSTQFEIIIENQLLCNHVGSHFIFHPFQVSKTNAVVKISSDYRISDSLIDDDFIETIKAIPSTELTAKKLEFTPETKVNYVKNLNSEISKLANSNLNKFIYSRLKTVENTSNLDLPKYLITLSKKHNSAFVYLLHHQISGTWLGATPETLISWKGNKITTMALAGTQPNNGNSPTWTNKEKEEQEYVTQYIEKAFSQSQIEYEKGAVHHVNAGPVFHLKTEISSKKNITYNQAKSLSNLLHPTPAVCGVPLDLAIQKIKEVETYNRAYYTGYLGLITPDKELNLFVNLRCMQVFKNQLALYLGGGITASSNAEKEWDETNFKAETLLSDLN